MKKMKTDFNLLLKTFKQDKKNINYEKVDVAKFRMLDYAIIWKLNLDINEWLILIDNTNINKKFLEEKNELHHINTFLNNNKINEKLESIKEEKEYKNNKHKI